MLSLEDGGHDSDCALFKFMRFVTKGWLRTFGVLITAILIRISLCLTIWTLRYRKPNISPTRTLDSLLQFKIVSDTLTIMLPRARYSTMHTERIQNLRTNKQFLKPITRMRIPLYTDSVFAILKYTYTLSCNGVVIFARFME